MNVQQNPAGLSALGVTVLIWIGTLAGLEIPGEVAASIVGLFAAGVSYFTPRDGA